MLYNQDNIPALMLYKWYCEERQCRSDDAGTDEGKTT